MFKQYGCSECERLWDEYKTAARNAYLLDSKVEIASQEQNLDAILRLQPDIHNIFERRRELRKQILAYDAGSHGQANSANGFDGYPKTAYLFVKCVIWGFFVAGIKDYISYKYHLTNQGDCNACVAHAF